MHIHQNGCCCESQIREGGEGRERVAEGRDYIGKGRQKPLSEMVLDLVISSEGEGKGANVAPFFMCQ